MNDLTPEELIEWEIRNKEPVAGDYAERLALEIEYEENMARDMFDLAARCEDPRMASKYRYHAIVAETAAWNLKR